MNEKIPGISEEEYGRFASVMDDMCEGDSLELKHRPRRLRQSKNQRDLVEENFLRKSDFIYPIFIKEGSNIKEEIKSMPGIYRFSLDTLIDELKEVVDLGIKAVALFPVIDPSKKSEYAEESFNPEGLTQRVIDEINQIFPELIVMTDVALDPYTTHGHDGLILDDRSSSMELGISNDPTVAVLVRMALAQAYAGADIVAPSDMMDGRVGAIREALDEHGFENVSIMAYTAKYASCFYAPFREALGSLDSNKPRTPMQEAIDKVMPKDKKSYQMNPANSREAMRELELDLSEGADYVMVKPASLYLDIISKFKEKSNVPVVAYQVSGEYAMIKNAAEAGLLDLDQAMHESLISIKRAGADLIISYFAKEYLMKLNRA